MERLVPPLSYTLMNALPITCPGRAASTTVPVVHLTVVAQLPLAGRWSHDLWAGHLLLLASGRRHTALLAPLPLLLLSLARATNRQLADHNE